MSQLHDLGVEKRYQRIAAVDGRAAATDHPTSLDPGNLGLWLTHEFIYRENISSDTHLHIVEDDVHFSHQAVAVFDHMLREPGALPEQWDLIFTDLLPMLTTGGFRYVRERLNLFRTSGIYTWMDLHDIDFVGSTSIFINKNSVPKILHLMEGKWADGLPIDIALRGHVHESQLKAYMLLPFLTTISPESLDSDIRGKLDRSRAVADVFRRSLFIEADLAALQREMLHLVEGSNISPLTQIFLETELYSLSESWERF